MTLEALDPEETLKFYPEGEGGKNPTIIHIKRSDVRDSIRWKRLFKPTRSPEGDKISIEQADDDIWFDYILKRVVKIENIIYERKLQTVEDREIIERILSGPLSKNIGRDLFNFMMDNGPLTEEQGKN